MNTAAMTERITEASPRLKARTTGAFYLLTFLTGGFALFVRGRLSLAASLIAGACYVAVTLLFYYIFKPMNKNLSLLAAFISLVGCAIGPLSAFHVVPSHINSLVSFGFYCLLIGYVFASVVVTITCFGSLERRCMFGKDQTTRTWKGPSHCVGDRACLLIKRRSHAGCGFNLSTVCLL